MSNFKVVKYTCDASASESSHIDAQIGVSASMVATNKNGRIKIGNIVAVVNTKNNVVQLAKVVAKEFHAQPWATDYKEVFNVSWIDKDVVVSDADKKLLHITETGANSKFMTNSSQEVFVKTVINNMSS